MPLIFSKNLESDPVRQCVAGGEDRNKQVIQRSRSHQCQSGAGASGSRETRYQVAYVVVSFASMDYDLPGEGVGVPAPFAPSCDTPGSSEPNQQRPTMLHQDQVTSMATHMVAQPNRVLERLAS